MTRGPRRAVSRDLGRRSFAAAAVLVVAAVFLVVQPWEPRVGRASFAGPPGAWARVFADEFGGSSLDRAAWQPDRSGAEAGLPFNWKIEDAWFDPANAVVDDGRLVLRVEERPRTVGERRYPLSTGMVQTTAAVRVAPPVYVEARIRFPGCDGCWPAFWLHPLDRWPPEIDIAEFLESGSERLPSFNSIDAGERRTGPDMYGDPRVDYRGAFHTYGVLWERDRVVPYLDGVPYESLAATEGVPALPMMIILNLSVRGGYDVAPGVRMEVDWVRVWEPTAS